MLDLKAMNSALDQLEAERGIPKEKILEAIKDALAAAYKKDYGKKGQIVRAHFDLNSGKTDFYQVKKVVDETMVRMEEEGEEEEENERDRRNIRSWNKEEETPEIGEDGEVKLPRFNAEQHLLIEDAKKIKKDVVVGEELIFPLEPKDDYGRIAAQTAKQVIIQRVREAERVSVVDEFEKRKGEVVTGSVQRIEYGNVYLDLGRVTGILPYNEQIPGERYRQGERIKAYLYAVEETSRDITLKLSRSHPKFLYKLLEIEVPEIANGVVEVKSIAREPGSRSKIAVSSNDEHIDPVGSCVGQRGVRVSTVMNELGGEKIDIIEWSPEISKFIERSLSPAHVVSVALEDAEQKATIEVSSDQYSLAIGKGGQNARLAAKLTGWKIDIRESGGQGFNTESEGPAADDPESPEVLQEESNGKQERDSSRAAKKKEE